MKEKNDRTGGVVGGSASTPKTSKKSILDYKASWLVIGLVVGLVIGLIL